MAHRLGKISAHLTASGPSVNNPAAVDPHAYVGQPVSALPTPCLLLDLPGLEANINTMSTRMAAQNVAWRPHCKAIRSPELALMFVEAGAVGVTCAKVSQAAALVAGGVRDVLLANQIVGAAKIAQLVEMAKAATVCVAVDDAANLRELSAAAVSAGAQLAVVVDLDIGMERCGVPSTYYDHTNDHATCIALCKLASALPNISWRGLMGYDGHAQEGTVESMAESRRCAAALKAARDAVEAAGMAVEVVTGAGSGNYVQAIGLDCVTECQGGGGTLNCQVYMDALGKQASAHQPALFLMIQVVSVASQEVSGRAIGDAGFKANVPLMGGLPQVISHPGVSVTALNAEHTILKVEKTAPRLALGEKLVLVPFYSDATAMLHRQFYGVRDGKVERIFDMSDSIGMLH